MKLNLLAYDQTNSVENILNEATNSILSIKHKDDNEPKSVHDLLGKVFTGLQHPVARMNTGYRDLDEMLGGLSPGDYVMIGARPSMGKSLFSMNIAMNMSDKMEKGLIAFFSLEMTSEQMVLRMLANESRIPLNKLRNPEKLHELDWPKLTIGASKLSEIKIVIDDSSGISPVDLRAKIGTMEDISVVIVDYIQLMDAGIICENRQQQLTVISKSLKEIAKKYNIIVIAVSQLNRGPEARMNKRPTLSDLRESGSLEQDPDIIMLLYHDFYYSGENEREFEVIVGKNRNGEVGTVKLYIEKSMMRVENLFLPRG